VLVNSATAEIAQICPSVDSVIIDHGQPARRLIEEIRSCDIDICISLFSEFRTAMVVFCAGVKYRLGPATKLAQIFFNDRLVQRRSASLKPEYEYNIDLIRAFLNKHNPMLPSLPRAPYLSFSAGVVEETLSGLRAVYGIPWWSELVIVHPGSGGSAGNLAPRGYSALIDSLSRSRGFFVLVTAGPGEVTIAEAVCDAVSQHRCAVHKSEGGLIEFAKVIASGKLFISGSTGPLHIAGALDVPTAAFYPRRRSSSALRWQTTNTADRRLSFSPPDSAPEADMDSIDLTWAASVINKKYFDG
jgi:ADP-heptose:LPS heptosyltransferase